jgi:hypothetical protein
MMKKGIFSLMVLSLISFRAEALFSLPIESLPSNSSTPAPRADSTKISPPGLQEPNQTGQWPSSTPQPQYPGVTVPTIQVTDEYYAQLKFCPPRVVCPDINGAFPSGTSGTDRVEGCPDSCRVERTVKFSTNPKTPAKIVATSPAICPPGYNAVATYKVDKEITQTTDDQPAPYPITSMATYNNYLAAGYTCTDQRQSDEVKGCVNYKFSLSLNSITMIKNNVGTYLSYGTDGYCYISTSSCTVLGTCDSNIGYNIFYHSAYAYKKCLLPKGTLYYTNNMIPTAVVCTVAKPTWRSLY